MFPGLKLEMPWLPVMNMYVGVATPLTDAALVAIAVLAAGTVSAGKRLDQDV